LVHDGDDLPPARRSVFELSMLGELSRMEQCTRIHLFDENALERDWLDEEKAQT
jgi:hypothetical protein